MDELTKYLKALVFLQVHQQSGDQFARPEILLRKAGLKVKEIAEILGKKENAVSMAISRAKVSAGGE